MVMLDGRPIYPQRVGRVLPVSQHGGFDRKVIHVSCTHDTIVPLPSVAHYHRMVRDHHGDQTDQHYRLWWVENAAHAAAEFLLALTTPEKNPGVWRSRLVSYDGVVREALASIVRWVEDDVAPAPSTAYRFTADSGLVLPGSAAERGGVQPVVRATANGGLRAAVRVGEPVAFTGFADQPAGTGTIVSAGWDFEGSGDFAQVHEVAGEAQSVRVEAAHAYAQPGTYFASFRVGAHRDGPGGKGPAVENGARVRVVVSAT
jgi:hypothetical protein